MILATHGVIAGKGTDADAQTFITAASIADNTQKNAINQLVLDLKSANIWTKIKALYPFVGGTAAQHRFNLKSPGTTNADFYLDFIGGGTHSADGYLPNGTTAYADTKMNANTNLNASSSHLSIYNTTANAIGTSRIYMGAISTLNSFTALTWGSGGTKEVGTIGGLGADYSGNLSAFAGHKIINTNGSRSARYFKNGIFQQSVLQTSNIPNINIYIGAANEEDNILPPSPNFFQNVNLAFASIGDGLSDSEATAFYNAVQTFNTTLNRQV